MPMVSHLVYLAMTIQRHVSLFALVVIVVHIALAAVLFYRKAWSHVPWLVLIVLLGLGFTPLLHYASPHLSKLGYFRLYYGIDALMFVLYAVCAWRLSKTVLSTISVSQVFYLGMKTISWVYVCSRLENCRYVMALIMRPVNLLLIAFWVWVIWRYDRGERRNTLCLTKSKFPQKRSRLSKL